MADQFVVHKFGGTSVGNAACFAKVAAIVAHLPDPRVAVVVSAMGGQPKVTDLLISLLALAQQRRADECTAILATIRAKHHEVVQALLPPDVAAAIDAAIARDLHAVAELLRSISIMRAYNDNVVEFISGHGEIWSAMILAAVLSATTRADGRRHSFRFVDAREFLTVESTSSGHGPVVQYDTSMQKLQALVQNDSTSGNGHGPLTHLVITGFICSTADGVMTTLKRDGSDFTASICGRVLRARSVTIWTDVSGVLSADPRRVPEARILPAISYQEAMELAYFGAKVIHPKTMAPAMLDNVPIYIRNTFAPADVGTKIADQCAVARTRSLSTGAPTARTVVSGFSTVDDLALFNVEGSGMVGVHGTSSRLFGALDRVQINVVLIAQASSEHSICFAVPQPAAAVARDVINETFFKEIHVGHIDAAAYVAPVSIIAAVGDQMNQTPGVCARFFGALGRAQINVLAISQGSSERNISAVVRYEDSAAALRAAHAAFFLSDQTLSIGLVGLELEAAAHDTGVALLKLIRQQRAFLTQRFHVDLRVRAIATHRSAQMLLDVDGDLTDDVGTTRRHEWVPFDARAFLDHVCVDHLPHWLIIDVSNSSEYVADLYPQWLARHVHVLTANVNIASVSTAAHKALQQTAMAHELTYDPEATLALGVPICHTLQNFLQTGDDVQRVEYSGSRVLHAVLDAVLACADPLQADLGPIVAHVIAQHKSACSVRDLMDDVMGVQSAKKAVMIAREMGVDMELADVVIERPWTGSHDHVETWSFDDLVAYLVDASGPLRQQIATAAADPTQALRLRQMTYIDASTGTISVRVEALAPTHAFAALQSRQGGFAFYTLRHSLHPVVVTGPLADCYITAGSLFGSTLAVARRCGAHHCGHEALRPLSSKA